jgi:hypothetical protein
MDASSSTYEAMQAGEHDELDESESQKQGHTVEYTTMQAEIAVEDY